MLNFFSTGGVVMTVIACMGLVALGVFFNGGWRLHRARIGWEDFLKGLFNVLRRGNIAEALSICADTPGPIAVLARCAIEHRDSAPEALRRALEATGAREIARLQRRLFVLPATAQIAPLLGLLGTILKLVEGVLAMRNQAPLVQRLDVLDPLLAALVITASGLTVAIPCYLCFNLLVIRIERIVLDMECAAAELTGFFLTPPTTEPKP